MSDTNKINSYQHVSHGRNELIIWFGGIGEPFLNSNFIHACETDALFLVDVACDWYMGGLSGVSSSYAETAEWIELLIEKHKYSKVFLGGQSSGGYAALHTAALLKKASGVTALAPQTRNLENFKKMMMPGVPIADLSKIYNDSMNFPVHLHIARSERLHMEEFFWDDWNQVDWLLERSHVMVTRYPSDRHPVSLDMYRHGIFYQTVINDVQMFRSYQ
ncbi:hypothetical protein [Azospirillum formosense]|uniref:hypothetical protein n=1 Tax=Azospirillum formosense TaxID=861533 RepID=UPI00338F3862